MAKITVAACCAALTLFITSSVNPTGAIAGSNQSKNYTATARDRAELKRLLRQHIWYGAGISRGVRAATGDPNIPVIDRRAIVGVMYSCSYYYLNRNKRTLLCD